jgi:hypothetical protein
LLAAPDLALGRISVSSDEEILNGTVNSSRKVLIAIAGTLFFCFR